MTQPLPTEHSPRDQRALTVTLLGGALAIAFEAYGTLTAMPAAANELGRVDLYAWAFTGFVIGQVLAIVVAGRLVDKIGPVLPLAVGVGIFIVGLLGAGLAPSMGALLVSRFVQGVGGGATNLAFMVVVAQAYGKHERAWLMSLLSLCWMLPGFLGPPISAWITIRFSWHWVFLGIVPFLTAVAIPGISPLVRLQRRRTATSEGTDPVPIWAAFAAAAGAAMLQLAGQLLGWHGLIVALAGLVVLLIGLPVLMPPGFLRGAGGLTAVMSTRLLICGAFFASESFLPLLLIQMHRFSLGQAGIFLALGSTGWTVGSVVQAWRRLRLRRDRIIQIGAVVIAATMTLATLAIWFSLHWIVLAASFVTGGVGMGLAVSSTSLANMQMSEPHLIGRNTSSLQVAEGLGNGLVTGVAGGLFAALHLAADAAVTFTPIYLLAAGVAGLAVWTSLRIGPVRNESANVG